MRAFSFRSAPSGRSPVPAGWLLVLCWLAGLLTCAGAGSAEQIRQIPLATAWISYDRHSNRIYASMPSSAGALGNTIAVVNPETAQVENSVYVGSEPGRSVLSDDGQYLYVYLGGSSTMRRVVLASLTPDLNFPLATGGVLHPDDMEVVPGAPHLLVVTMYRPGISPRSEGTAVFENGVRRQKIAGWINNHTCLDGSRIWLFNNETSEKKGQPASITVNGIENVGPSTRLIWDGKHHGGLIYCGGGKVFDPVSQLILGTYPGAEVGPVVDEAAGRVYYLNGTDGNTRLAAYQKERFIPLDTVAIAGVTGRPNCFSGYGQDGFIFRTQNKIFVIGGTSNPPPTFTVRGTVRANGSGLSGVTVTGGGQTASTDASGAYTLSGLAEGTFQVQPSRANYTFAPTARSVTVGPDQTGVDFTATEVTYSIRGTVTRDGTALAGVTVSAGTTSDTTAADGTYSLMGLAAGTYTVTPSLGGFTFAPVSRSVAVGPDRTGVDFAASAEASPVTLQELMVTPKKVRGGRTLVGMVRFSAPIRSATTLTITSSNEAVVPEVELSLASGTSSSAFTVRTRRTRKRVSRVELSAAYGGVDRTATVVVRR